jgi:DnaJ domain
MKDLYYILGTGENCTSIEIKEAYRKLSKKFHPDLNQNDKYFENRFREIQEAYETLNDPVRRARYDADLRKSRSASSNKTSSQNYSYKPPQGAYYQARTTTSPRSKTTGIDIVFTIILILITLIFGDYVYKTIYTPKANKPFNAPVISTVAYIAPLKHHKKKHYLKTKPGTEAPKVGAASISTPAVKPTPVPQPVPSPALVPVVIKKPDPIASYLYTTRLHSNLTGIINMHEFDKYSSAIVQQIPTGAEVYVLEKGDTYYKIRFNNTVGYVPRWTVMMK